MGEKHLGRFGSMFGMDDPGQVLPQIKRYVEDGRLEISEVMAVELVAKLRAEKKREVEMQNWLVEAARIAAEVLEQRGKFTQALAAALTLEKERRALRSMLAGLQPEAVAALDLQAAEDYVIAGRIAAQCGKLGKAVKLAKKAEKTVSGHLGSAIVCVQAHALAKKNLRGAAKPALSLAVRLRQVGPVIRKSGDFSLCPQGQPATDLTWLLVNLDYWLEPSLGLAEKAADELRQVSTELRAQISAIESGEQAADAQLQAAVDKLNPTTDYHSYSRN